MNVRASPIYATLNYKYQSLYAKVQKYVTVRFQSFVAAMTRNKQVGRFGLFWSEEL